MYHLVWLFIVIVSLYDVTFAYANKDTIQEWELNPFARYFIDQFGLDILIAFRLFTVTFGWLVVKFSRFKWEITSLVLLIHLVLCGVYLYD